MIIKDSGEVSVIFFKPTHYLQCMFCKGVTKFKIEKLNSKGLY